MDTNRQGFRYFLAAPRAILACVPGVNFKHCPTSFFRFVGQQLKEHSPGTICYRLGQMPVSHHVFDTELLNAYSSVLTDVRIGYFMQKIFALIRGFLVGFSYKKTSFFSALRSFLSAAQCSLSAPEKFLRFSKILRVFNAITIRIHKKRFDPNVYANLMRGFRILFRRNIVAGKSNEPFAGRTPADSDCFDHAFDRTGEKKLKHPDMLDIKISTLELPTRLLERERVVSVNRLESRKTGLAIFSVEPAEKRFVGLVKSFNNILQYLGTHRTEFVRRFSQFRKLSLLPVRRNVLAFFLVSVYPLSKRLIIKITTEFKPVITVGFCLLVYPGFVEIGFFHFLLWDSMYFWIVALLTLPAVLAKYECVHNDGSFKRDGNSLRNSRELIPLKPLTILSTERVGYADTKR